MGDTAPVLGPSHYTVTGLADGGSSSGETITTPAPTPAKDNLTNGKTDILTTVDQSGNAAVTVTEKIAADAIKAAQDTAKKQGLAGKMISVEIAVTTDTTANQITTTLQRTVQDMLINNKADSIKITSNTIFMRFAKKRGTSLMG